MKSGTYPTVCVSCARTRELYPGKEASSALKVGWETSLNVLLELQWRTPRKLGNGRVWAEVHEPSYGEGR